MKTRNTIAAAINTIKIKSITSILACSLDSFNFIKFCIIQIRFHGVKVGSG